MLPNGKVLVVGGASTNVVSITSAELYDPATETWAPTGSLQTSRNGHTATLLPNGKVLVVGGEQFFNSAIDSAEIYDPASGTWTATAPLAAARETHTATLLPSGNVLVAGGYGKNRGGALTSAEIYDPVKGTWIGTGSLLTARQAHAATLLRGGKVLVAGGFNENAGGLSSAELYDPAAGTWTVTGSLSTAHVQPRATLLPTGKVLLSGGGTTSAEIYDVVSGSWSTVASFAAFHNGASATLLPSGDVLVAGGGDNDVTAVVERFIPTAGNWTTTGSLAVVRRLHTATLLPNGKLLVVGGLDGSNVPTASAELYDPRSGKWTGTGSLLAARYQHTATLLQNGKVLVAGGDGGDEARRYLSSTELYDPSTGIWSMTGSLLIGRDEHSATLLPSGKILVAGGATSGGLPPVAAELYDPAKGTWAATGMPVSRRSQHTAILLQDGKVLLAGGDVSSAELYDPATGAFTVTGSASITRFWNSAALLPSGEVLVIGGYISGVNLLSAEMYNPATGTWRSTAPLVFGRSNATATVLPNGKVLVVGGASSASAEVFDPATGIWTTTTAPAFNRLAHTATLLPSGQVLLAGGGVSSSELYSPQAIVAKPTLTSVSGSLRYDAPTVLIGNGFGGVPEGSDGATGSSPVNYPLFQLRSVENNHVAWLLPDSLANFFDDPMTVVVSKLPSAADPGWNWLTPVRAGVWGASTLVQVVCGLVVSSQPKNLTVAIGNKAIFAVEAQGGRHFQWQKNMGSGWVSTGDDASIYVTDFVTASDAGTRYRVVVNGACSSVTSSEAVLTIADSTRPVATVVSPAGGDYWLLSTVSNSPNTKVVTWSMSDDVRICQVMVSLLYSNDGGTTYVSVPPGGGLPATFGPGGSCSLPGESTTSASYTLPTIFPSGRSGSLYMIEVAVSDQAGNVQTARSANPFYIVQANPDTVKTLILWNSARMISRHGINAEQTAILRGKLEELSNHPRVQGLVVDLSGVTTLQSLYLTWDTDPSDARKANAVLFGSGGIHDFITTSLVTAYSGVKYLLVIGDDRIIPMARIQDHTALLPESSYPAGGDLTTNTTVGQALAGDKYLTDDPLAVLDPITADQLDGTLFLPDLVVGRLVETPQQIVATIATYIGQGGVLDLSQLDGVTGHKVLVTGYDFLSSVASEERKLWKSAFRALTSDNAQAPVDGSLVGGGWGPGSVQARASTLRARLSGNGGQRYAIAALNGHATHFEEGVPGTDALDIQGLSTAEIYGPDNCGTSSSGRLDLAGAVVYAVGCHGGLSVPGSCRTDPNRSLDLPETMLARGVVAYIANSGYGWGLRFGIGYGARLSQIFTEQLTSGGTIAIGDAVRQAKLRYYLESPRYDAYDEKTMMQWTLYGVPMYAIKTGITAGASLRSRAPAYLAKEERLDAVGVRRQLRTPTESNIRVQSPNVSSAGKLPPYLTQLSLSFDFTGSGVYEKHNSSGQQLPAGPGCPDANGCYYTLNGLVDRGTGSADLPIEPYVIYDSRLSGTSEHSALWKGGTYLEESGWRPVIAQLVSNGGNSSNHGSAPRHIRIRPTAQRVVPGLDAPNCRASDLEVNSLTVAAGEALKNQTSDPVFSINRLYRAIDMEVFYFNNRSSSSDNCDRDGPVLATGPFSGQYHTVSGTTVSWTVRALDPAGVWRVLIVYNPNTVDAQGTGSWIPLELTNDGSGTFRGNVTVSGSTRLTYVIQAVDNRGNVTWLDYTTTELPSSGVPLGIPLPVDVDLSPTKNSKHRAVRH